jgi:hypothetical protein
VTQQAMMLEPFQVPRLDDLRVLKMMRTTNTRPRARFALAALALVRLNRGPSGRGKLFVPIPGVKETKSIVAEGKATTWQEAFLNRLEESGLITTDEGGCSVATDRRVDFEQVAASAFNGDGLALKKLIWPSDYDDESAVDGAAVAAEPGRGEELPEADAQSQLLSDLTKTLTALVGTMQSTLASVSALGERMSALETKLVGNVDAVRRAMGSIEAVSGSFEKAAARQDKMIGLLEDEGRREIVAIKQMMSDNYGRARSVANQLDSVVTRETELVGKLNEILEKKGKP